MTNPTDTNGRAGPVKHLPLYFDNNDAETTATKLAFALFPEWEHSEGALDFTRFTDGITNNLLKIGKRRPGWTEEQTDADAILLRAYGRGTDVLIDREREIRAHSVLSSQSLAPPLLAHFENGLLYRFMRGTVCTPEDLRRPEVYRGVASRLGQWHAVLPVSAIASKPSPTYAPSPVDSLLGDRQSTDAVVDGDTKKTPRDNAAPTPNLWGIMQRWIQALPTDTEAKLQRRDQLQQELEWIVKELGDTPGIGDSPYVFSHCDLLSGNVIIMADADNPKDTTLSSAKPDSTPLNISFIDYEYATPAPAAFDLANHFAEWAGFDCDHASVPTRSQRRDFLRHYLDAYNTHTQHNHSSTTATDADLQQLVEQVDRFRGLPGFYWGIWALIQALISQIEFDYAGYAEVRLGEYWAWKEAEGWEGKTGVRGSGVGSGAEVDGGGKEAPLRERRWAED
ncbi:putative choline/ethanolamine kinase [Viridothelium virens]|uniref:ethanolamine kinase n=1 Tax=Viridothelium virens TaxID=1048519 RepID=A0A6A6HJI2_VIRVR|nr:putative choline/ethanolamine kinase [Viridothelium virens]